MKKYAVAVLNLFDNVNEVHIVEANSEIEAMIVAVGDDVEMFDDFKTTQDVKNYYYNGEISVSEPVEI